jgi:hypothetical protein
VKIRFVVGIYGVQKGVMEMFGTLKLSLNENIAAFFGWVTVLASFSKIWVNFFPNLLVTLDKVVMPFQQSCL